MCLDSRLMICLTSVALNSKLQERRTCPEHSALKGGFAAMIGEKVKSIAFLGSYLFYSMLLRDRRPPKWRASHEIPETSRKSSADKMLGSCPLKDQSLKKTRTLLFPERFHESVR